MGVLHVLCVLRLRYVHMLPMVLGLLGQLLLLLLVVVEGCQLLCLVLVQLRVLHVLCQLGVLQVRLVLGGKLQLGHGVAHVVAAHGVTHGVTHELLLMLLGRQLLLSLLSLDALQNRSCLRVLLGQPAAPGAVCSMQPYNKLSMYNSTGERWQLTARLCRGLHARPGCQGFGSKLPSKSMHDCHVAAPQAFSCISARGTLMQRALTSGKDRPCAVGKIDPTLHRECSPPTGCSIPLSPFCSLSNLRFTALIVL